MKKFILKTPLAKPAKETEAWLQKIRVLSQPNNRIIGNKTTYCISPYKTGTTFLSSGFESKISAHEPLQYLTICEYENNFDDFFIRRLNYLNLKIESSGYLSAYIDSIKSNKIAKDLNYISIIREPSKWVTSVLNYWETLEFLNFDYIDKLFWNKKVGISLIDFNNRSDSEKNKIIKRLIEFYLSFTEDTFKLKNIRHVQIYDLEKFMENELSNEINEKIIKSNLYKRENVKKKKYMDEKADAKYKQIFLKHDYSV